MGVKSIDLRHFLFSNGVSFLSSSVGKESACNVGDLGGWEDPLEEGMAGNPLKYSCLENH